MNNPELPVELRQRIIRHLELAPVWAEHLEFLAHQIMHLYPREGTSEFNTFVRKFQGEIGGRFLYTFWEVYQSEMSYAEARATVEARFEFFSNILKTLIRGCSHTEWMWIVRSDLDFCHQVDMESDMFEIVAAYLNRLKAMSLAYVRGISAVAHQTN